MSDNVAIEFFFDAAYTQPVAATGFQFFDVTTVQPISLKLQFQGQDQPIRNESLENFYDLDPKVFYMVKTAPNNTTSGYKLSYTGVKGPFPISDLDNPTTLLTGGSPTLGTQGYHLSVVLTGVTVQPIIVDDD